MSAQTGLDVQIGSAHGHLFGHVEFEDVRVEGLFSAKSVRFQYRFLDFLSKSFASQFSVVIQDPEVYWSPPTGLNRRSRFPIFGWVREWALSQKEQISVRVDNMTVHLPGGDKITGVAMMYQDSAFEIEVPVRHVELLGMDLSTTVKLEGRFEFMPLTQEEVITGRMATEGTVINWKPAVYESSAQFELSHDAGQITARLMNHLDLEGVVDFQAGNQIRLKLNGKDIPLSDFDFLMGGAIGEGAAPGRVDIFIDIHGNPDTPNTEIRFHMIDGWLKAKNFKAISVNLIGIYPTLMVTDSRILLEDGSVMRLANKPVELSTLFQSGVLESLISQAEQDTVVWGNWEFRRPADIRENPEFLMERSLGEKAKLQFRRFNVEEEVVEPDAEKMEVGFEFRLRSKDSVKLGLREEERFVGVERKLQF